MQAWKGISLHINNFIKFSPQNQQIHIVTLLYLVQVKAVLFAVISVSSYYCFLGSTLFKIAQSIIVLGHTSYAKMQAYMESISQQ